MIVQHVPATLLGGRQPLLNSNRRRPASYVRSHDLQVINLVRARPQRNPVGPGSKWIPERASSSFSGEVDTVCPTVGPISLKFSVIRSRQLN